MPASDSVAILAVQLSTFLQGPLVAIGEPAAPRQPPPAVEAPPAPGAGWLVPHAPPPPSEQPPATGTQ